MSLVFQSADEVTVRAFWGWQYEVPYDVYDLTSEDIEEEVRYFLDPEVNCYAVKDAMGELVAYCTFGSDGRVPGGDYDAEALDIGLGVRPDLTGQGQGSNYVSAVLDFARRTYSPPAFRVTVAEFNTRALRVWEKAGFRRVQRFGRNPDGMEFVIMMRES
jgi:RimJ/RimL family protein N-acetyltransferase